MNLRKNLRYQWPLEMGKRRKARILAMHALYQAEIGKQQLASALGNALAGEKDEEVRRYAEEIASGCWQNLPRIDQLLKELIKKWELERVQSVERAVLRLALYEMLYRDDIPHRVIINEAIEIAKQFGDTESGRFVNGILAAALRQKQGVE